MKCARCNADDLSPSEMFCGKCGQPVQTIAALPSLAVARNWNQPSLRNVPNYLAPAILVTLFCCLPAGIISIIYAAQVSSKLAAGDIQGAMAASKNARTWTLVSLGLSLLVILIFVIFNVLGLLVSSR